MLVVSVLLRQLVQGYFHIVADELQQFLPALGCEYLLHHLVLFGEPAQPSGLGLLLLLLLWFVVEHDFGDID